MPILIALVLSVTLFLFPASAQAGSSSLIRAFDDVVVTGKDFAGQSLIEAEFASENLSEADFTNTDLRGAVFNGCTLHNANFEGANFDTGIAYLSDFKGANLRNAIFTEAMLLRSKFDDVEVEGADFTDAVLDRIQQQKLCSRAQGVNPTTGVNTRDSLLCF
jgi:uncharacterized protein YjbI with pentapeptide repeats